MAIEPLVIESNQAAFNNSRPDNSIKNQQDSIADRLKSQREDEDKNKASEKEAEQKSDRISLSDNALQVLSSREGGETNNERSFDPSLQATGQEVRAEQNNDFAGRLKRTQEVAVELRGIQEIAKNRNLSDAEVLKSSDLRSELSTILDDSSLSLEVVSDIADKAIIDAREAAAPVIAKISNGQEVTGDEFSKINSANRLLNKSNGFGIKGFSDNLSFEDKNRLDGLKEQSDSFLASKGDEKLAANELDFVQRLQTQISSIEGFRLNVKDSIGPEGVVI